MIWIAYFVIPNDAGGLVHGIPLGPIEAAALLMLAWLGIVGARIPGATVVAILLAVTYITGAAIPGEGGFRARYFANAAATGGHERSTEFRDAAFTRIDRQLDFDADRRQFPLPFFNDNSRFNFYKVGEPQRRYLEFAVRWSGLWWVDRRSRVSTSTRRRRPDRSSSTARKPSRWPRGVGSPAVRELSLTPGWHRLDVTFSSPYAAGRVLLERHHERRCARAIRCVDGGDAADSRLADDVGAGPAPDQDRCRCGAAGVPGVGVRHHARARDSRVADSLQRPRFASPTCSGCSPPWLRPRR